MKHVFEAGKSAKFVSNWFYLLRYAALHFKTKSCDQCDVSMSD